MGDQPLGRMVQSVYLDNSSEPASGIIGTGAGIGVKMSYNRMNSDHLRHGGASNAHDNDDTLIISSHQQSFD